MGLCLPLEDDRLGLDAISAAEIEDLNSTAAPTRAVRIKVDDGTPLPDIVEKRPLVLGERECADSMNTNIIDPIDFDFVLIRAEEQRLGIRLAEVCSSDPL
jgi:hypothetical protein